MKYVHNDDLADVGRYTPDEALEIYSGNGVYDSLNYALRMDTGDLQRFTQLIHALQQALKGQSVGGTVWRGTCLTQQEVDFYKPGFQFLWPAFTSTSRTAEVARGFESGCQSGRGVKVLFEIELHGEGVTWSRDISMYSQFPREAEVLLYCYSGFKVVDCRDADADGVVYVKLTTVDTLQVEGGGRRRLSQSSQVSQPATATRTGARSRASTTANAQPSQLEGNPAGTNQGTATSKGATATVNTRPSQLQSNTARTDQGTGTKRRTATSTRAGDLKRAKVASAAETTGEEGLGARFLRWAGLR